MDWRYLIAWLPMVLIAILNGLFREIVLRKRMPEPQAHQLSCLTGIALFAAFVWRLSLLWPLTSTSGALFVGLSWLVLTVAFEFLFGHYVAHHSWRHLLAEYRIATGRLWLIVLVWITLSPCLFYYIQHLHD